MRNLDGRKRRLGILVSFTLLISIFSPAYAFARGEQIIPVCAIWGVLIFIFFIALFFWKEERKAKIILLVIFLLMNFYFFSTSRPFCLNEGQFLKLIYNFPKLTGFLFFLLSLIPTVFVYLVIRYRRKNKRKEEGRLS